MMPGPHTVLNTLEMDPIGVHSFWRFSPALDYQQVHRTVFGGEGGTTEPLCILLVQPSDPTSIIKTIAQRFRHSTRPLHFYIYERVPEVLARHMFLLSVATDWELPIRQRAHLWLEVYGNALVQARTAAYISAKRAMLMDVLCCGRGPAPLPTLIDAYTLLKHRARDEVEGVLKTWDSGIAYDVTLYRDTRIRSHLGARYDSRDNVADWDYNAVVKCGAGCIHGRQYREWRRSGVAFEYGDERYDHPNRTLGSYAEGKAKRRGSVMARGFWGDTVVSPYRAMGTTAFVPTDEEVRAGLDIAAAAAAAASAATAAGASPTASITSSTTTSTSSASNGGSEGAPSLPTPSHGTTTVANHAASLFDVLNRRQGSEQWRHHAVELATYNVLAWLWEIESGRTYVMTRDNDIYSGLERVAGSGGVKKGEKGEEEKEGEGEQEEGEEKEEGGTTAGAPAPSASAIAAAAAGASVEGSPTPPITEEVHPLPQEKTKQQGQQDQPEPVPPPVLTPEEAEGVQRGMRAAALARAKTIARTFKGVTCTLIGGDFKADFLDRGDLSTNRLAGKVHLLALSTRSAHHLAHPHLDTLLHCSGASVVVETGRNIPEVLTGEQRGEMTRRILGMGGGELGGVVCGSDRALSADTYAVGTVLGGGEDINSSSSSTSTTASAATRSSHRHFIPPRGGIPPSGPATPYTSPLPLASTGSPGGTDALPRPPTFGGRPPAFVNGVGAISSAGTPLSRPARCKAGGMASFSHRIGPLPCLSFPPGEEGGYGKRAGREAFALAQGVATHPWEGGDNPAPEAIVFAWVEALAEHVKAGYKDASGESGEGGGGKKEEGK